MKFAAFVAALCLALSVAVSVSLPTTTRLGKGAACNECGSCCNPGLRCVGNVGNKRCFPPRLAGDMCGQDPFWDCAGSLECRNGVCVNPDSVAVGCNAPGSRCAPGLVCVGNVGNKRCFPPRLGGDKCGKDPFWECSGRFVCNSIGMCVRPVGKSGACNAPDAACRTGLVCVGNVGNKRCFPPMRLGDKCGKDPFWVCTQGLRCRNGTCVK